jgi:hypothetical protein
MRLVTSLTRDNPRAGELLTRAVNGESTKLSTVMGQPIAVKDVVVHSCQLGESEDGEILMGTRVVLITPEGRCYWSVAGGVLMSFDLLTQVYGFPPWEPARMLQLVERVTKPPRRTHVLQEVNQCPNPSDIPSPKRTKG